MDTLAEQSDNCSDLIAVPPEKPSRSDDQIADAIAAVLDWTSTLASGISASVDNGCVTLEGTVGFRYQRQAAERAVRRMAGVLAVDNRVVVATTEVAEDVRNAIRSSIRRRLDQPVVVFPDPTASSPF